MWIQGELSRAPASISSAASEPDRLRQLAEAAGTDLSVVVLEKGSEVGAHILSGAVFEPRALNELFPDWKERGAPIKTEVTSDSFLVLGEAGSVRIPAWPMPRLKPSGASSIRRKCSAAPKSTSPSRCATR